MVVLLESLRKNTWDAGGHGYDRWLKSGVSG
jgi:hypothetical protein